MRPFAFLGLWAALCSTAHARNSLHPLKGGWQRYSNDRFGTVSDIPPGFQPYGEPPANGNGREFRRPDGARLRVYGSHLSIDEYEKLGTSDADLTDRYHASGKGWVVHSGRKGATIEYRRSVERCGSTHSIHFEYPAASKKSAF